MPLNPTLAEVLTPFVGAKLTLKRDANGYVIRPSAAVDLRCPGCHKIDADIRSVGPAGVEVFFYKGCDLIPWADLYEVEVREIDALGNTLSSRVYPADLAEAA